MENSCIHCNRGFRSSYIRKSIPLLCLLLVSSVLSAQTLTLESSQPAHMSEGVDLNTTVSFTFSEALDVNTIVSEDLGDYILVRPENAVSIDSAYYSDDHMTIFLDVEHHQETDYVWTFTGLPNPENVMMDRFRVVNYTTSSTVSDITIEGGLSFEERPMMFEKSIPEESLSKISYESQAMNTQGMTDNPGHTFSSRLSSPYPDHQMESMEKLLSSTLEASGDEDISWGHTMVWVLESLDFMYNEESDGPGDELVNIGVANPATGNYLVENMRAGDYYVLALLTQPSSDFDVIGFGFLEDDDGLPLMLTVDDAGLTNLDITIYGFTGESEPIDASEAFVLAEDAMAGYPDARPVEMWGNDSALEDFNYYGEGAAAPSGKSYFWEVIYLDDVDSLVYFTMAAGSSAWMVESFHLSEIPYEERPPVSFEDIMTIPDPFISSQTALDIAGDNGVDSLLALADSDSWIDIEYMLSGFYFEYPNILDADSPFFWSVMLESYGWDYETQTTQVIEAYFLIDAETGALLGKMIDSYSDVEELVDFQDIFPMLEMAMAGINENSWLIQSFGQEDFYLPQHPDGSSYEWMLVWFDPTTVMVDIFHTSGMEITDYQHFPLSDVPEEERPPVDLIRPVSGVTIRSTEAFNTAMDNGLFETLNAIPEEYSTWINYSLHRFYFTHPELLDEDSNPVWEIELTAEAYNESWELIDSLKVFHLVDAVTGDHLASNIITTAEPTADLPSRIALHQNYPNPFNPVTNIGWELDAERHVSLIVFDLLGRKVATLADQSYPAGVHILPFDASRLASGVYIYQLDTDGVILNRKMTVVK